MDPRPPTATTSSDDWAVMMDESQAVPELDAKIQEYAVKYSFELDIFQKQAIIKLEEGYHVLVAAHTSAGKTVVAEHAIAMAARNSTRAIYTSPTKALSNEKHKEFERIYRDVGLMTGDVQKNQAAKLLVMTTEILRSMLYDQDKRLKDLEIVVMDEMHYMSDVERGHAWEEVVIMLPKDVRLVMLSATLGDPMHFASWLGGIKQRKVFVVSTTRRPVPLKHYLYTGASVSNREGMYLIVDEYGNFQPTAYEEAFDVVSAWEGGYAELPGDTNRTCGERMSLGAKTHMWCSLLENLQKKKKLPAVIFVFSRDGCEISARCVSDETQFTNAAEKNRIEKYLKKSLNEKLTAEERRLPQVTWFIMILKSGVAVHHSSMLPILREIVEVLYQVGLIKVLFATETLAIGVNMPTRTVVFESTTKFDGQSSRNLKPAEYAQMAGRAGRRGLDETGDVLVVVCEHLPEVHTLKTILVAKPEKLQSQFRLTDVMVLNLLESQPMSVLAMIEQSFRQYNRKEKPQNTCREKLQLAEREYLETFTTPLLSNGEGFQQFFNAAMEYINVQNKIMPILLSNPKILKELVPGKVLVVSKGPYINTLGVLLNNKIKLSLGGPEQTPYKVFILDTKIDGHMELGNNFYRMLGFSAQYDSIGTKESTTNFTVIEIALEHILSISHLSLPLDHKVIMDVWERRQLPRFKDSPVGPVCTSAAEELSSLSCSIYSGTTTLNYIDLVTSLMYPTRQIKTYIRKMKDCEKQIKELKKYTDTVTLTEFAIFYKRMLAKQKLDKYKELTYGHLELYPEFQRRLKLLRELGFIDDWERLTMMGRFARHLSPYSILITQLVYQDVFTSIPLNAIPALLSAFVYQAPSPRNYITVTQAYLDQGHDKLEEAVLTTMRLSDGLCKIRAKYSVDSRFENRIDFNFREVTLMWTLKVPFEDIMDNYKTNEGILVKCILQIHEILISLIEGATEVGNKNLEAIMREAAEMIKRDIIYSGTKTQQEDDQSMGQCYDQAGKHNRDLLRAAAAYECVFRAIRMLLEGLIKNPFRKKWSSLMCKRNQFRSIFNNGKGVEHLIPFLK